MIRGGSRNDAAPLSGARCTAAAATIAALLLAACEPIPPDAEVGPFAQASPEDGFRSTSHACSDPVTVKIAFSAPDASDTFRIEAIGETCEESSLVVTLRAEGGGLLWTHASRARDAAPLETDAASRRPFDDRIGQIMALWAGEVEVTPSSAAPDWPEGAARPSRTGGPFYETGFPREDYLRLREDIRPMLCHAVTAAERACVLYIDDGSGGFALDYFAEVY
ncbi:hypothetical protein GC169_12320 [bacterium]|nr:hypothetical protein [bacterium]